jgi:DNA-binding response OmpR family regulator
LRVLVADDDHDTVDTLVTILQDEAHTALGVYSGKDVLPAVRFFRPDAIIIDISIPGISGYAVAQAIRHTFTDVRRPLMIAISGVWREGADRIVARQVGFDHHLVKPCDPAEILRLLDALRRPSPEPPAQHS